MKYGVSQKYGLALLLCLSLVASLCVACSGITAPGATVSSRATTVATPRPPQRTSGALALNSPVIYVALGASDAVGVGCSEPDEQGYVPRIAAHLPRGSHLVNLGETGLLLHDALSEKVPETIAAKPQLITVWLAANDLVARVPYAEYMNDLDTLLQRLHKGTQARIVMANLPDLTLLPALARLTQVQKKQTYAEIQRWDKQIAVLSQKYQVTLVDLFAQDDQLTGHPEYISQDGFHPSATGYARLAEMFWKAIHPS